MAQSFAGSGRYWWVMLHASHRIRIAFASLVLIGFASIPASADDAFEPNDSFAQAQPIAPGSYSLSAANDDWFVVQNLPPGQIRVNAPGATGLLNIFLWRADAQNPGGGCATPNGCLVAPPLPLQYVFVSTQSVYIQVVPVNPGAAISYTLDVETAVSFPGDDATDDGIGNDSITTATPVPPTLDVGGLISLDQDFFAAVVLPGQFSACIEFDPALGNVDLDLYDANFTRIATSAALTTEGCKFHQPASATPNRRKVEWLVVQEGPLFVAARGTAGVPYRLTLDLPTQWLTRLPYGPIRTSSITLADLDGDGKEEILVGTSKGLGPALQEILPAALVCLNSDGSERWHFSPPAIPGADPQTGLFYQTSSVSTTPVVGDVDGDGDLDVVFGAGADTSGEGDPNLRTGQPGDLGAVYAVDAATGSLEWVRVSEDVVGGLSGTGDGIPDGVYSTPVIANIDGGPTPEVVYGGWDQRVWILDGATGCPKNGVLRAAACTSTPDACAEGGLCRDGSILFDTIWSSPAIADLDEDGFSDVLIGGDITTNPEAGTTTGGIFHVLDRNGKQDIPGFDQELNVAPTNPGYDPIYGKYEEQTVWSSPAVADFDGDHHLEIAYGTSFFGLLPSTVGRYVRVWNHDGTEYRTFTTAGQTFSTPLFADLTGDGSMELVETDMSGRVYAWSAASDAGTPLFSTLTVPWAPPGETFHPIIGSPLAVDLNNDGVLEIVYMQGPQVVVVDANGVQQSDPTRLRGAAHGFLGSPAIGDINRDRILDIITGGSVVGESPCACVDVASCGCKRGVVFSFRYDDTLLPPDSSFRFAKRMFRPVPEPGLPGAGLAAISAIAALARARRIRVG